MRVWSEKNGSVDVTVYGFSFIDNLIVVLGGLIVLLGCVVSLAVIS
ncbi:hypothetical protein PSC71_08200 [Devosia sp. J2-20]|nr:hypothetical protein [Devosia sp. J2-20]WDR00715.1 hypothetical protein PSC71_08200 [Devosia sp. J2-20]